MDSKNLLETAIAKMECLDVDNELKDVLRSALFYVKYLTFDNLDLQDELMTTKKTLERALDELRSLNRRVNDLEYYHN